MWYIVSPAAAAKSTSERPNGDWRRGWRNTEMPARGGWWRSQLKRNTRGSTTTRSTGRRPPYWTMAEDRSCWWRRPCTSRWHLWKSASTKMEDWKSLVAGPLWWGGREGGAILTDLWVSDSGSSPRRHEIFPLINYAGSGHANRPRFEQSRCILVRRTPINYISLGCSMPVLSIGDSWWKFAWSMFFLANFSRFKRA